MRILAIVAVIALAGSANAAGAAKANNSVDTSPKLSATADLDSGSTHTQGLRVSLLAPLLEAKFEARGYGQKFESSEKLDSAFGVAVGYASLPVQALGFTANAAYLNIKEANETEGYARIDGNLAYMTNKMIGFRGGLNLANFTKKEIRDTYKTGVGVQAAMILQINDNFGADLGYTVMNNSASEQGVDVDLKIEGIELGVTATF